MLTCWFVFLVTAAYGTESRPLQGPKSTSEEFAPRIIQHPSDTVVRRDQPITMNCRAEGYPEPTTEWYHNGVKMDFSKFHGSLINGGSIFFYQIKGRSDEGLYICVAKNALGMAISKNASLTISKPLLFTIKPADRITKSGTTVQFFCGVHGVPRPTIQWSKEQGILPTGRYAITNENTLSLQRVTVQDSGKYICTARNQVDQVSVKAQLVVEDPQDTDQRDRQKDILQELNAVRVYLDTLTVLNSSSVRLQWRVSSLSQHTEGYVVFYRPHSLLNSEWIKAQSVPINENSAVITVISKGQRYEFKVRPYGQAAFGTDSNIKHIQIPDGVPEHTPQDINITMTDDSNGSLIINWTPPQYDHTIKGYRVWCLGNETLYYGNWTVGAETRNLKIAMLPVGITYKIQVAAIYDAGVGQPSQPKYIFRESPEVKEAAKTNDISLDIILQVIRHPAFIATVGGTVWITLMATVVYLCQHHSKPYSSKKHSGLYRFASEDTIIKQRMDISDSPWLPNTWKSASCSRNCSSMTSMNSQLLWMENTEALDFCKSTISLERKSESSRNQIIPLVPNSSSMYGALYVDLPGKEMTTFQCPLPTRLPGMGISAKSATSPALLDHGLFPKCISHASATQLVHGGSRSQISRKPVLPVLPSVALKEPWSQNSKRELHHVNSAPLSPVGQADNQSGSVPSMRSLDGTIQGKEYAKVIKTFSSPKLLQYTASLKVMDLLSYTSSLPPPPVPPPKEESTPEVQATQIPEQSSHDESQPNSPHKLGCTTKKAPPDTLNFNQIPSCTFPINDENVLTPDDVAHYLEHSEKGDNARYHSESDSIFPRPFSSSSTYGYICSPLSSELIEMDTVEEDDDLELGDVNSLQSYRKYCETPTSSISEYESSMASSLVNGWGSVSEDNYISARCSMISSSDGSFLMDASFAKALAVAVDSFCLGMSQSEATGAERFYSDFSPSASPLDGLLAPHNLGDSIDQNSQKPKVNPLPVLDWNIDWMDEMEANYTQRNSGKTQYPFVKKMDPLK
ncbi:roundabout homolog 4 isoform X2 [Hyperolius riggenbachi]|uniref:roundabout homolog 4 isoform X2 n=1 Tax=Hyperolius riggenbachi TaxID=752182 RepID=UPI0035A3C635